MKRLANGLKLSFGILLSIVFMYLAFRKVDFHQMINAIRDVNYIFLFLIVVVVLLNDWLRALRWQYLLMPIKRIDIGSLFSSLIIGYTANVLLPAHLGEFLRAYVIGKKRNIPASSAFATIVTERVVDIFSLLILMGFTLVIYPFPVWVKKSGYLMFLATVALVLFLVILKRKTETALSFVHFVLRPFPETVSSKILKMLFSFSEGLVWLKSWKHYLAITFLSILIWACYGLFFILGFLAFDFHLPWVAPLVLLITTTMSVVVPSSPGYIGTYHWICQLSLGLFGIAKSPALAFAFVIHGVNIFPFFLLGLVLAWKEGVSISRMTESYRLKQEASDSTNLCFDPQSVA